MSELKYTDDHEWLRLEADGTLTIGITTHAQEQLGDIVFVKLPDVGRSIKAGEDAVVIESVKAAADIKMPVSGEVVAVNTLLNDSPETVNQDPMDTGWFLRVRPDGKSDFSGLMDKAAYEKLVGK
jgi:glycine cleavage system H protein